MATKIPMIKVGLSMTEGILSKWLVKEGDVVKKGDNVAEMETDKLSYPIPATADGTIIKIVAREGEELPVGAPIAYIGQPGETL